MQMDVKVVDESEDKELRAKLESLDGALWSYVEERIRKVIKQKERFILGANFDDPEQRTLAHRAQGAIEALEGVLSYPRNTLASLPAKELDKLD